MLIKYAKHSRITDTLLKKKMCSATLVGTEKNLWNNANKKYGNSPFKILIVRWQHDILRRQLYHGVMVCITGPQLMGALGLGHTPQDLLVM
jgi:hypothetical protein